MTEYTACESCNMRIEGFLHGNLPLEIAKIGVYSCNHHAIENEEELMKTIHEAGEDIPKDLKLNLP